MGSSSSKYQLELDKEKQKELILENQRPEDIHARLNSHKAENRNFKQYVNLIHIDEKNRVS